MRRTAAGWLAVLVVCAAGAASAQEDTGSAAGHGGGAGRRDAGRGDANAAHADIEAASDSDADSNADSDTDTDTAADTAAVTATATDADASDAAPTEDGPFTLPPPIVERPPEPVHLRVAVAGNPPFVVRQGDGWEGISVEMWREVAERANATYELVPYTNVTRALAAVSTKEADVAIGPISITAERAQRVAFTQPYFESALAIASKTGGERWLDRFAPFLSKAFLAGAALLLLVLLGVGTLLWITERSVNPDHFPSKPLPGIANGVWLALVTMTTVGYGDRAPVTPRGRVIAGVWMLLSMLTASSLTAFLATALTLSQIGDTTIETAQDLDGHVVAAPRGTTSVAFARRFAGRVLEVDDAMAGLRAVHGGRADATVFDRPALAYELANDPDLDVALAEREYEPVGYGFAVAVGSDLREVIDVSLLELRESDRLDTIRAQWLGN